MLLGVGVGGGSEGPGTKKRMILLTGTLDALTSCQAMTLTQLSENAI